jgi:GAF domain-containing protein
MFIAFDLLAFSKTKTEVEQSQMALEQAAVELEQARSAQREAEESRRASTHLGACQAREGHQHGLVRVRCSRRADAR